jgi:uncharacterized membrane protein YdjX (TVP38/TMEM64 family)
MLYLTPVMPLGLVSYMCGTTAMNVYAFLFAKIFALPLYLIYTFMGASAHSFVKRGANNESVAGISASDQAKHLQDNQTFLISGLVLSIIMMSLITRHIRKELMKVSRIWPSLNRRERKGVVSVESNFCYKILSCHHPDPRRTKEG